MSARNLLWKKYSNPPLDKVPSIYYVITFSTEGVHKKSIIALLFVHKRGVGQKMTFSMLIACTRPCKGEGVKMSLNVLM